MMRSLFSGVSGLRNHQTRMDVIGNNIANVNTVGFKRSRVNFQDMLSQNFRSATRPQDNRGGTNPMQVGLGMSVASIDTIHTPGSAQNTGKETDLTIQGDGFFIVKNGNTPYYTRNGAFDFDTDGNLVSTANGFFVQGWMKDAAGVIDTTQPTTGLKLVVGQPMAAQKTTEMNLEKNLQVWNNDMLTMQDAENALAGNAIIAGSAMKLVPTSNANQYRVTFSGLDPAYSQADGPGGPLIVTLRDNGRILSITGSTVISDGTTDSVVSINAGFNPDAFTGTIAQLDFATILETTGGEITALSDDPIALTQPYSVKQRVFDALGRNYDAIMTFTPVNDTTWTTSMTIDGIAPNAPATFPDLRFTGTGIYSSGNFSVRFEVGPTTNDVIEFDVNFDNVTQYNTDFTIYASQDGYEPGSLDSFNIDGNGLVTGEFSNGVNTPIGKIAMSVFNNPGGLRKEGDSLYYPSNNSGDPQVGTAGTGGRGLMISSSLEMSNVDLSEEFTNMIITQRGFQANSRIITTSDEMLQELVNLKR
jgi:flagellar hook protein FlgE